MRNMKAIDAQITTTINRGKQQQKWEPSESGEIKGEGHRGEI